VSSAFAEPMDPSDAGVLYGEMSRLSPQHVGIVLVTLSAVAWSTAGIFTRLVSANTWAIIGWRGIFSAFLVMMFVVVRERGRTVKSFSELGPAGWAVASLSALSSIFYIAALLWTTVANVMVIYATTPFIAAAVAWAAIGERPALTTLVASGIALVGVSIMVGGAGAGNVVGLGLATAMAVGMAIMTVMSRNTRSISMIPATCLGAVQLGFVGAVMTPLPDVSSHDIAVLAAFSLFSAFAFGAYLEGSRHLASSRSALISALDVPLGPLWVALFIGEIPSAAAIVGGIVVLIAVAYDVVRTTR
jgi:drug/metabolite transporter (DMT)-like permease